MNTTKQNIRQRISFAKRPCGFPLQRQLLLPLALVNFIAFFLGVASTATVAPEHYQHERLQATASSGVVQSERDCMDVGDLPIRGLNLTEQELRLLPQLCWPKDGPILSLGEVQSPGVPRGVECNITSWCDTENHCSSVCARGSVLVDSWLQNALATQWSLARRLPFCLATLFGTHNSAITMADGYGNLDAFFQQYFSLISWVASDAVLRTNDQWLSLTDQLNLGVRSVELDTHWVEGALRIAHCGGFHSLLNTLVQAVNLVAKLLRHPIHWDTETIGCNPSLSSIAVLDQRTFKDALQEIAQWLALPQNADEFLVLYLDDQPDLLAWGKVDALLADILSVFSVDMIYTPVEHDALPKGAWPSINDFVDLGRRLLFVSASDYGLAMRSLIFPREGPLMCSWVEPPLSLFQPEPDCAVATEKHPIPEPTLHGRLLRMTSCEIMYGPLNCDFVWRPDNGMLLDENNLPSVARCGINMPAPDLLTTPRAASHIWTWAKGHPQQLKRRHSPWLPWPVLHLWEALFDLPELPGCAAISESDGRWRTLDCSLVLPTACRFADSTWLLVPGQEGRVPARFCL
eukprot:jgi/Botrbrau1/4559/Bobra.60_2s0046.1